MNAIKRAIAWAQSHWIGRSIFAGFVATAVDLATVIALGPDVLKLLHPYEATPIGVTLGGIVSFLLNKKYAMRNTDPRWVRQAVLYAIGFLAQIALHTTIVFFATERFHINYIIAKLAADLLAFAGFSLLLVRFVVFRPQR